MSRKTKRIYYGPDENPCAFWWDVEWENAKKTVKINGTLEHAIEGIAGSSIGCRLSNCAIDVENQSAFPHPVHIAAFYKTTALIVDKLAKNGTPCHAVVYEHEYGNFVDLNDVSNLEPVYKDRSFVLRAPSQRKKVPVQKPQAANEFAVEIPFSALKPSKASKADEITEHSVEVFTPSSSPKHAAAFKGAMGRAVKAGILGRPAAGQMARAMKKVLEQA